MADAWLEVEDCAAEIKVSVAWMYRHIATKEIPAHKFGNLWRIKTSEWEAYKEGNRTTPSEQDVK